MAVLSCLNRAQVFGWSVVFVSTAFTFFWAFWGALENFHERERALPVSERRRHGARGDAAKYLALAYGGRGRTLGDAPRSECWRRLGCGETAGALPNTPGQGNTAVAATVDGDLLVDEHGD